METVRVGFASRLRDYKSRVKGVPPHDLRHRVIVGMKIDGRPAVNMAQRHRWGIDPRIDVRRLPLDTALRIERFIRAHYVNSERDYNCFTFMQYVAGLHHETGNASWKFHFHGKQVRAREMRPFQPYVLYKGNIRTGQPMHGVICFTNTQICLSVLGNNNSLAWAPIDALLPTYGSNTIMELSSITPR